MGIPCRAIVNTCKQALFNKVITKKWSEKVEENQIFFIKLEGELLQMRQF